MQLAAILVKLKEYKKKNILNELKNENGEIVCCFLACDSMSPYIDDYFSNLPKSLSTLPMRCSLSPCVHAIP